jgi:hypothetical protein
MKHVALLVLVIALAVAGAAAGTARADTGAAPQAQVGDPCTLFSFSTGPIDVNVAGQLIVHVDPIGANVQLSGLLGTIVCPLLGGTAAPAPLP